MRSNNDVFVKLNYKTIGEFKSLIIDRELGCSEENKYMMCAGNYNKDGWTFVFKANSIKEAEELINNNKFSAKPVYGTTRESKCTEEINEKIYNNTNLHIIENDLVQIPAWM